MSKNVTKDSLLTALRTVGVLGSVEAGYFDHLFQPEAPVGVSLKYQYSSNGVTDWTDIIKPGDRYWRWSADGGATYSPENVRFRTDNFGWFAYSNLDRPQELTGGQWTTIENDGAGPTTGSMPPMGVTRMLDVSTGRVLLDELSDGDEVYMRHVINMIPKTNGLQFQFRHSFGSEAQRVNLPAGSRVVLNEGGGVPTQDFLLDTHFYIDNEDTRLSGMMPQVYVSNDAIIEYTGCYISVTRR
jgi:hypothetical protein